MVGQTHWTTDQLARILHCHRNHTSSRMIQFCQLAEQTLLARPRRLASSGRPDRAAEAAVAFLRTGGQLATSDPAALRRLLAAIARDSGQAYGPRG